MEKPQGSHGVLASGQDRVSTWMITVLSLKVRGAITTLLKTGACMEQEQDLEQIHTHI